MLFAHCHSAALRRLCLLGSLFVVSLLAAQPAPRAKSAELQRALDEATRLSSTPSGRAYVDAANKAIGPALAAGMRDCFPRIGIPTSRFEMVFVLDATGRVRRVVHDPRDATVGCFAQKIRATTFPKPPGAGWHMFFGFTPAPR